MKGVKFKYRRKPIKEAEGEPVSGEQPTEQTTDAAEKSAEKENDQTSSDSETKKNEMDAKIVAYKVARTALVTAMNNDLLTIDRGINNIRAKGITPDTIKMINAEYLRRLLKKAEHERKLLEHDKTFIAYCDSVGRLAEETASTADSDNNAQ